MKRINLYKIKAHLWKLVKFSLQSKEIIVCQLRKSVAKSAPFQDSSKVRKPGMWAEKVSIKKDFDILTENFMGYFE